MVTVSDSDHRSSTGTEFSGENLNGNSSAEVRPDNHPSGEAESISISSVDRFPPPPSSSVSAPSENCDANDSNAMDSKKQAWNKASNGGIVVDIDGGCSVMGADAWPALVESARSSPKLVADDSPLKPTGEAAAQGSINLPPQQPAKNNAKSNHSLKQSLVARQRSSRRGGGGGSSMGGPARILYRPLTLPPPPPFPVFQVPGSSYYNVTPAVIDPFPGNPLFSSSNIWDPRPVAGFMSQTNFATTDQRNFFPMENLAFHPHGDSHYYHNNRGGNRDRDRRMYSNVQDAHFQNHMPPPRGFMIPSPPYIAQLPQHVRPHGNPIPPPREFVYAPTLPMEPYTDLPPMPQPSVHSAYHYDIDPILSANLVYQIEYYFSDNNLIKDTFLRSNMDG